MGWLLPAHAPSGRRSRAAATLLHTHAHFVMHDCSCTTCSTPIASCSRPLPSPSSTSFTAPPALAPPPPRRRRLRRRRRPSLLLPPLPRSLLLPLRRRRCLPLSRRRRLLPPPSRRRERACVRAACRAAGQPRSTPRRLCPCSPLPPPCPPFHPPRSPVSPTPALCARRPHPHPHMGTRWVEPSERAVYTPHHLTHTHSARGRVRGGEGGINRVREGGG